MIQKKTTQPTMAEPDQVLEDVLQFAARVYAEIQEVRDAALEGDTRKAAKSTLNILKMSGASLWLMDGGIGASRLGGGARAMKRQRRIEDLDAEIEKLKGEAEEFGVLRAAVIDALKRGFNRPAYIDDGSGRLAVALGEEIGGMLMKREEENAPEAVAPEAEASVNQALIKRVEILSGDLAALTLAVTGAHPIFGPGGNPWPRPETPKESLHASRLAFRVVEMAQEGRAALLAQEAQMFGNFNDSLKKPPPRVSIKPFIP